MKEFLHYYYMQQFGYSMLMGRLRNVISCIRYDGSEFPFASGLAMAPPLETPPSDPRQPPYDLDRAFPVSGGRDGRDSTVGEFARALSTGELAVRLNLEGNIEIQYISDGALDSIGFYREEVLGKPLDLLGIERAGVSISQHDGFIKKHLAGEYSQHYFVLIWRAQQLAPLPRYFDSAGIYSAFISYSRKQGEFVTRIARFLYNREYSIWLDQNEIAVGELFQEHITRGIERSNKFIIFLSADSLRSVYCNEEIELAIKFNKPILVVRLQIEDNQDNLFKEFAAKYPECRFVNWVQFRPGIDDPRRGFAEIVEFLDKDGEFFEECTKRLTRAIAWDSLVGSQKTDNLLRGAEASLAEAWLTMVKDQPRGVAPIVRKFIKQSNDQATLQKRLPYMVVGVLAVATTIGSVVVGLSYLQAREANRELQIVAIESRINAALSRSNYALFQQNLLPCGALDRARLAYQDAVEARLDLEEMKTFRQDILFQSHIDRLSQSVLYTQQVLTDLLAIPRSPQVDLASYQQLLDVAAREASELASAGTCETSRNPVAPFKRLPD